MTNSLLKKESVDHRTFNPPDRKANRQQSLCHRCTVSVSTISYLACPVNVWTWKNSTDHTNRGTESKQSKTGGPECKDADDNEK